MDLINFGIWKFNSLYAVRSGSKLHRAKRPGLSEIARSQKAQ